MTAPRRTLYQEVLDDMARRAATGEHVRALRPRRCGWRADVHGRGPDVARELAQILLGAGKRTNDGGWLKDAEALLNAAATAEQAA